MKIFSIHTVRNVLAVVIVCGLGYMAYLANPSSVGTPKVEAGTGDNISGFAWSENIGWISFNSTSDGSATSYGVNVDTSTKATGGTGFFSGQAWSENIGWISFNSGDTDPACGTTHAQINWSTGKVSGWARALSGTAGGWDGCISLSGMTNEATPKPYGVAISGNTFSGYAWGSVAIGWIDFAPSVNGIPVGVKLAGVSCTEALVDTSGTWGTCMPSRTCTVAEAGTTVTGVAGIKTGLCSAADGGGQTIASCNNAVLVCPAGAPAPGKKKFWQF